MLETSKDLLILKFNALFTNMVKVCPPEALFNQGWVELRRVPKYPCDKLLTDFLAFQAVSDHSNTQLFLLPVIIFIVVAMIGVGAYLIFRDTGPSDPNIMDTSKPSSSEVPDFKNYQKPIKFLDLLECDENSSPEEYRFVRWSIQKILEFNKRFMDKEGVVEKARRARRDAEEVAARPKPTPAEIRERLNCPDSDRIPRAPGDQPSDGSSSDDDFSDFAD